MSARERPILFSGAMVRAILAGTKTQTRRLVTPSTSSIGSLPLSSWPSLSFYKPVVGLTARADKGGPTNPFCPRTGEQYLHVPHVNGDTVHRVYSRIEVGMRLWVRETWRVHDLAEAEIAYRADGSTRRFLSDGDEAWWRQWAAKSTGPLRADHRTERWCPAIYMKPWSARLHLDVTSVRVERLQAITMEDARAEGAAHRIAPGGDLSGAFEHTDRTINFVAHFRDLWDEINAARAPWSSNPWVWVVEFRRVHP